MTVELGIILFVFGVAIGSFLNVVALRYDGDHFVADPKVIGGRSHCPYCQKTLAWYELIPVVSYVLQRGKCRNCKARLGFQYPFVELLSGLIFIAVPLRLFSFYGAGALPTQGEWFLVALWIVAFELLLLVSYIDIRLQIVPDELTIALGVIAILIGLLTSGYAGGLNVSFLTNYAAVLGLQNSYWLAHIAGALIGALFFYLLVVVTPYVFGKEGMGMGDVKLALPIGLLFGWPDIILLYGFSFVTGAVIGLGLIAFKKKGRKAELPFVPFIAAGAALLFFVGLGVVTWYFRIIGL